MTLILALVHVLFALPGFASDPQCRTETSVSTQLNELANNTKDACDQVKAKKAAPRTVTKVKKVLLVPGGPIPEAVFKARLLPRGSALITSSGALAKQGITAIIHAASGSMFRQEEQFKPTLQGVQESVAHSLRLAEANDHKRVAIPFIGGNIFLEQIGLTKEQLADGIVKSALRLLGSETEVRFVAYSNEDFAIFKQIVEKRRGQFSAQQVDVVQGSITDFKVHGASAIVNAANMEVQFGAGVSGIIGKATGASKKIDQEAAQGISSLYPQQPKKKAPANKK